MHLVNRENLSIFSQKSFGFKCIFSWTVDFWATKQQQLTQSTQSAKHDRTKEECKRAKKELNAF